MCVKVFIQLVIILVLLCSCKLSANGYPTKNNDQKNVSCRHQSCREHPNKINVHLVPHSHLDLGWIRTFDDYYKHDVSNIINSILEALHQTPARKFILVEGAYIWIWWTKNQDRHASLKSLLKSGQLEFVGGGWSMNDEATTHYQSLIDQFTLGLRFLNDTFGARGVPKIGWQIDTFGHSSEMASIFSQLGFDALFLGRIDYRDYAKRTKTKTAELIWQGSRSLGTASTIFTNILYDFYVTPKNVSQVLNYDDDVCFPINTPSMKWSQETIEYFLNYIEDQAKRYKTNNIMILFGGDFAFGKGSCSYKDIDELILYTNEMQAYKGRNINVAYSTPYTYIKRVHEAALANNLTFPLKTDDFFPYASEPKAYWTGYYTSRPTLKRLERQGNNLLQVTKQLYAMNKMRKNASLGNIFPLQQAMGIMQHHDAITGTSQRHVALDYTNMLLTAFNVAIEKVGLAVKNLLAKSDKAPVLGLQTCMLANISICNITNKNKFVIVIYNPLGRYISHYVRVPVNEGIFTIKGENGKKLNYQLTPSIHNFSYVAYNDSRSEFDLVFLAKQLPPLGIKMFYVEKVEGRVIKNIDNSSNRYKLGNENFSCIINKESGLIEEIRNEKIIIAINQEFLSYKSMSGMSSPRSGAYIFRPDKRMENKMEISSNPAKAMFYKGKLFDEVHQVLNNWTRQIIRIYKSEKIIEFDWLVESSMSNNDLMSEEIISRFSTDLRTNKFFYTDSNGKEMIKRIRDYRHTYCISDDDNEPAKNYYPVTSRIAIEDIDRKVRFTILTDRAQGGSSASDGEIELMVHRKMVEDDNRGVVESLNEKEFGKGLVVRGHHYIIFGEQAKTIKLERDLALRKLLTPWNFFATFKNINFNDLKNNYNFKYAGLTKPMPKNVHILTLESISEDKYLLRLEHIFEKDEDPLLSQPVQVNIEHLFSSVRVKTIKETTLGGNRWIEEIHRLKWKTNKNIKNFTTHNSQTNKDTYKTQKFKVKLKPMEIRTFIITVENIK